MFTYSRILLALAMGVAAVQLTCGNASANTDNDSGAYSQEQLQQMYMSFLSKEGYRPELTEDGNVLFKAEGMHFVIYCRADDPFSFVMVLPNIFTVEEPDMEVALECANDVIGRVKMAKILILEQRVWVVSEQFVAQPEHFEGVFQRTLEQLRYAGRVYADDLQQAQQPAGPMM